VGRFGRDITVRAAPIDPAKIMSHEQHPALQPVRIGCSGWNLYVYFNNDWEAFAPSDALELRRQVRRLADEGDELK
jgi:hypothetical protein